jgi:glyoxylase-like metal-dependent hydrolase (beta-lactamase superfamily II)
MILRRIIVSPLAENVYIVGDEETKECAIIDPGAEAGRILEEVKRLGLVVRLIVNTHGHVDHIGAVAAVKEATGAAYAIHQGDIPIIRDSQRSPFRSMIPDFRDPPDPDRTLKGGDTLEVGGLRFLVLETPGHTPGGISLYGHNLVFTGDTLFQGSIGRFDIPGASGHQLLNSILTKLMVLPEETRVLPGHGPETTIGRERRYNPFLRGGLPFR